MFIVLAPGLAPSRVIASHIRLNSLFICTVLSWLSTRVLQAGVDIMANDREIVRLFFDDIAISWGC